MTKKRWSTLLLVWFTVVVGGLSASRLAGAAEKVFYRYVNDDGVQVLDHRIPPEYAQNGYEIVSVTGQVIKVVEPAISKAEAEKAAAERRVREHLKKWDESLRRRYSAIEDIEAAKKRKLLQLEANISILRTNITGIREQIVSQQSRAAGIERLGKPVPENLLDNIKILQMELETTQEQVEQRVDEYEKLAAKYDRDIERFQKISEKE